MCSLCILLFSILIIVFFVSLICYFGLCFFFFKQKTAYEMRISDWSSDVCSSDLRPDGRIARMDFDAIVIGGGHNGLVCAWYLARGGKRVLVLERREIVGGAAVTEEFVPGFRNSTASYTLGLLDPRIKIGRAHV